MRRVPAFEKRKEEIRAPFFNLRKSAGTRKMAQMDSSPQKRFSGALRWAIYDVGHTAFSMIVLAVLFPILFNEFWSAPQTAPSDKTFRYSLTLAAASVLVALLSPLLATIAQHGGLRMKFFRVLAGTGIVGMAALAFIDAGFWQAAAVVYVCAAVGFFGANLFYDSLLLDVAAPEKRHFVSGLSFSAGYLGGVILLGVVVVWTQSYGVLGFSERPDPRLLFGFGAVWWLAFALPLLTRRERGSAGTPSGGGKPSLRAEFSALKETCAAFWRERRVRSFMLAYFCYIDGVHTIITSAVRYGNALGFSADDLFLALFIVQIFGVPCAVIFGGLGKKFGARTILFVALAVYVGVSLYGALMPAGTLDIFGVGISPMFVLAALIGMVQGGVQALSRSFFATLVPAGREVSFFGFYCMIGRCSTILGPLLIAFIAAVVPAGEDGLFSTRAGIASVALLFIAGALLLSRVKRGNADATRER